MELKTRPRLPGVPTESDVRRQQENEKIRLQEEGFAHDRKKEAQKNNDIIAYDQYGNPSANFWNKYDEQNQDAKPKMKSDIFMENYLAQPMARKLYYNINQPKIKMVKK
jgi:hypothetical protein